MARDLASLYSRSFSSSADAQAEVGLWYEAVLEETVAGEEAVRDTGRLGVFWLTSAGAAKAGRLRVAETCELASDRAISTYCVPLVGRTLRLLLS